MIPDAGLGCCVVALVVAAIMFVDPVMSKVASFVGRRPTVAGVAGALLALVALAVPYVLLFHN